MKWLCLLGRIPMRLYWDNININHHETEVATTTHTLSQSTTTHTIAQSATRTLISHLPQSTTHPPAMCHSHFLSPISHLLQSLTHTDFQSTTHPFSSNQPISSTLPSPHLHASTVTPTTTTTTIHDRQFLRYLKQLMLRRRHLIETPRTLPQRIHAYLEYPFVFARDVTIPTVDPSLWYKPYAVLQPLLAPLFLLEMTGTLNHTKPASVS